MSKNTETTLRKDLYDHFENKKSETIPTRTVLVNLCHFEKRTFKTFLTFITSLMFKISKLKTKQKLLSLKFNH